MVPIEVLCGFFFLVIALALVGPGQHSGGRSRVPNRLEAYTINILGSIVGIVLFAACSFLELPPAWWFAIVMAGSAGSLCPRTAAAWRVLGRTGARAGPRVARRALAAEGPHSRGRRTTASTTPRERLINVNLIGHQQMEPRDAPFPAYALPHLLNRDAGGRPFDDVLIIGAGSGNDVAGRSRGAPQHVDAVEIDPVIQRIGKRDHPDKPYDDPRVYRPPRRRPQLPESVNKQYDLIIYALVDSLVLHSGYSNIRLESYLFTKQAFEDVKKAPQAGRRVRDVQLFPPGLDRGAPAERAAGGVRRRRARARPAEPRSPRPGGGSRRRFTLLLAGDDRAFRHAFAQQPVLAAAAGSHRRSPGALHYPPAKELPVGDAGRRRSRTRRHGCAWAGAGEFRDRRGSPPTTGPSCTCASRWSPV